MEHTRTAVSHRPRLGRDARWRVHTLVCSKHNVVVGVGVGCGDGCDGGRLAGVVGYPVGKLNFAHEAGCAACGEVRDRGDDF